MKKSLGIALRFLALMAALTLIAALFAPAGPGKTPYVSGLSDLTASPALASHHPCFTSACGPGGLACHAFENPEVFCVVKQDGTCKNVPCH